MIRILEKAIKNKRSNFLKSDLDIYLVEGEQTTEYPKRTWFKGSRYR